MNHNYCVRCSGGSPGFLCVECMQNELYALRRLPDLIHMRHAREPRHSREDHECEECEALAEVMIAIRLRTGRRKVGNVKS